MTKQVEKIIQEGDSEWSKLVDRIRKKNITLSFSSFSQFAKSPSHFMQYKLKKFEQTDAMIFGSMVHCLVLEGKEEFDKRYIVRDESLSIPKSSQEKSFCVEVSQGVEPIIAFRNNYKSTKDDTRAANEKVNKNEKFISYLKDINGRIEVSNTNFSLAESMKKKIFSNDASRYVMDRITETEVKANWDFCGFKWIGYIDGKGDGIKCDLKIVSDADPKKFKWKIRDMRYDWQAALYGMSDKDKSDHYIIAIDKLLNISVVRMQPKDLVVARESMEWYMSKFKLCSLMNNWNASYDFYSKSGIFDYSMI